MAGETPITVVGNLTADPRLEFTTSGIAVASFTVASTPRYFSKKNNQFEDGEPLFINCQVWREAADNVADTLKKGMRVIATGELVVRNYERKDGSRGTSVEMRNVEVGPSLRFARAQVERNAPSGGQGYGNANYGSNQGGGASGYGYGQNSDQNAQPYGGPQGGAPQGVWAEGTDAESDFDSAPPF